MWDGQPYLRRGQLLTATSLAGGKVIHQLGRSDFPGSLPALVNNFGNRIRDGERRCSGSGVFFNRKIGNPKSIIRRWLDAPPEFPDETRAEAEKVEQVGPRWPTVQDVLAELETLDIHRIDVSPSNIAFPD